MGLAAALSNRIVRRWTFDPAGRIIQTVHGCFQYRPVAERQESCADLTDVTLIVDRSGSMLAIRSEAERGVNDFIASQVAVPGELLLSLVQFDTTCEVLHHAVPVANVPRYTLQPRGNTALLDAIGRSIDETGLRLAAMPEAERPGLVMMVILTDGAENASSTYSYDRIAEMIQHQQSVYSWKFIFLSSDLNAIRSAKDLGIADHGVACFRAANVSEAWHVMGNKVVAMRQSRQVTSDVTVQFSEDERRQME